MSPKKSHNYTQEELLGYDPGRVPTRPSPNKGETITIAVKGLPPYKDQHFSIRNKRHKAHDRFRLLRKAAFSMMAGRACYPGPMKMEIDIHAPPDVLDKTLSDYLSGTADTLDGSAGPSFTFLPIVYQDDCQLAALSTQLIEDDTTRYTVRCTFL